MNFLARESCNAGPRKRPSCLQCLCGPVPTRAYSAYTCLHVPTELPTELALASYAARRVGPGLADDDGRRLIGVGLDQAVRIFDLPSRTQG